MTAGGFAAGTLSCTCGDQKNLPDVQNIAGQSIQTFNSVYGGVIFSGKEPEGITGLDDVADRIRFGTGGGSILTDSLICLIQCVPGTGADDSIRSKVFRLLEGNYRLPGTASKDTVLGKRRNAGIILTDHI